MKIDKEYPATHSMSTAWYCVDEDGNVGIFDIDENGPVPKGWEKDLEVNEMFWYDFSSENKDGFRDLNLNIEQIKPMLLPMEVSDKWEEHSSCNESWIFNGSWYEVIIKIDMAKLPILMKAASMDIQEDDYNIVCLSRKEGYFFVQFAYNRKGVELLEENKVIIAKYKAPKYDEICPYEKKPEIQDAENNRFPIFIYDEEYHPEDGPAKRMSNPTCPMKIYQLPKEIQEKITQLPVRFKDTKHIQLAEHIPVYISDAKFRFIGDERWQQICSSKGETIYYSEKSNRVLSKEELDKL